MIRRVKFKIDPLAGMTIMRGEKATKAEVREAAESIVEGAMADVDDLRTHENEFVRSIYPEIKKHLKESAFSWIWEPEDGPPLDGLIVSLEIEEPEPVTIGGGIHISIGSISDGEDAVVHLTAATA